MSLDAEVRGQRIHLAYLIAAENVCGALTKHAPDHILPPPAEEDTAAMPPTSPKHVNWPKEIAEFNADQLNCIKNFVRRNFVAIVSREDAGVE